MNLFYYLMNKNDKILVDNNHMLEYLLNKSGTEKEVSGTEINITDVTKAKIIKLTLDKESTQDGIPTPENPVEVKTVKGYRNLFDKDNLTYLDNAYVSSNGVIGSDNRYALIYTYLKSGSYTISNLSMSSFQWVLSDIDSVPALQSQANPKYVVNDVQQVNYTLNNDGYILIRVIKDTFSIQELANKLQIVEGTESLPYVPYGTNWIYTKVTGKNLFNRYDGNLINGRLDENGNVVSSAAWRTVYIKCNQNTDYTISGVTTTNGAVCECIYDENMSFISSPGKYRNQTFTTPANAKYLGISVDINDLGKFQIEEGSTATTYEAYKENIVTLPLNDNEIVGKGINLDELIINKKGKCYLNKKFAKIDSYNGETITTNYMSTTGSLTTGATVYYVLATEQLIDLNYNVDIRLFNGVNNISNSDNMNMTLIYK